MSTQYKTEDFLVLPGQGEVKGNMTIKVRTERLGGDFSIMENTLQPGELIAPHDHQREDQAVYVIDGDLEFEVGGDDGLRFTATAGSYVIKPRNVQHTFWNATASPVRYIELSGRHGFEEFVEDTVDAGIKDIAKAQVRYGVTFHVHRIPKLMKKHDLEKVAGISQ